MYQVRRLATGKLPDSGNGSSEGRRVRANAPLVADARANLVSWLCRWRVF